MGAKDWNDIALAAKGVVGVPSWDVVVIDEAQDFSANQVRAVLAHLAEDFSMTFVMDAMQRIYPRFFAWNEVGIAIKPGDTYTLTQNYRNTRQIAAFARPIVEGLDVELLQRLGSQRLHRDRHVLDVLRAPLRSNGDLGECAQVGLGRVGRGRSSRRAHGHASQDSGYRK